MRKGMCKHYHGSRVLCDKQLNVREVTGDEPEGWLLRIPCIREPLGTFSGAQRSHWNRKVSCPSYEEPSDEEVADFDEEVSEHIRRMQVIEPVVQKIKSENKDVDAAGEMECPLCKTGTVKWSINQYNGHVWMKCSISDCINFVE